MVETVNGATEETVTQEGTKRARRREGEKESSRQTDSFDSVRFELAGFGEYGSFVVRRGPCGYFLLSISPLRSFSLSRAIRGREPSRTERTSYLPVLPDGRCASQPEEKLSGNEAAARGGRGGREDVRTYGPVVRNTCLRELVPRVSLVSAWPSIRDQAKATMYYHR